jgi:hypothetical protein
MAWSHECHHAATAAKGRPLKMTTTKKKTTIQTVTPATKARVAKPSAKAAPVRADPTPKVARPKRPAIAPHGGTKTEQILDLLKRPGGVTLTELAKATGWKPNSVRGFLSGAIGKKMGMPVESLKSKDGGRSYLLPSK